MELKWIQIIQVFFIYILHSLYFFLYVHEA